MMRSLLTKLHWTKRTVKVLTIEEVQENWNDFSHEYNTFDYCPQTFYYTFTNILELQKAHNILEVACGTGKLLPLMLQLKNSAASYLASDLAPNMVELAKTNLKKNFDRYESRLSFEEWCSKQNLNFAVVNAEQPIENSKPFDRIICNLCLMITSDARKMLTNLHAHSSPGCLLGVSVWGNKDKNTLMNHIRESLEENHFELPEERSLFHLYGKVPALAAETGWEVVTRWEQNAPFPMYAYDLARDKDLYHYQLNKLPEEQRSKVWEKLEKKIKKSFENKGTLNFDVEMFILKRK
jgi:SAM-dependent methyltransferase